jgi:phage-related protein
MFIATGFSYNGIANTATGIGVILVKTESGFLEDNFGEARNIVEEPLQDISKPIFYGLTKEPLSFTITIALDESSGNTEWTSTSRKAIINWLFTDNYASFISDDDPTLIYKAIAIGQSKFFNNAAGRGYCTIEFRCDSSHGYLATAVSSFASTANTSTITYTNLSDIGVYSPEIQITMNNASSFSIINHSNGDLNTSLTGLANSEVVYINNEKMQIISSVTGAYRYNNFSKVFLELTSGINTLYLKGDATLEIRSAFPQII